VSCLGGGGGGGRGLLRSSSASWPIHTLCKVVSRTPIVCYTIGGNKRTTHQTKLNASITASTVKELKHQKTNCKSLWPVRLYRIKYYLHFLLEMWYPPILAKKKVHYPPILFIVGLAFHWPIVKLHGPLIN
jgi:hypothetical protein